MTVQIDNGTVYTLLRRAGEGGYGTVFVAYDEENDLMVALKACEDPGDTNRMDREAQILKALFKLQHPNIVTFLSRSALSRQLLVLNSK